MKDRIMQLIAAVRDPDALAVTICALIEGEVQAAISIERISHIEKQRTEWRLRKRAQYSRDITGKGEYIDNNTKLNKSSINTPSRDITGTRYSEGFVAFWGEYPRKQNKAAANKAFKKAAKAEGGEAALLAKCRVALAWQRRLPDWTKERGQFIPHPATYLNGGGYDDEPPRPSAPPSGFLPKPTITYISGGPDEA